MVMPGVNIGHKASVCLVSQSLMPIVGRVSVVAVAVALKINLDHTYTLVNEYCPLPIIVDASTR